MSQQKNEGRKKKKNYFLSSSSNSFILFPTPSFTIRDCGTPDFSDMSFNLFIKDSSRVNVILFFIVSSPIFNDTHKVLLMQYLFNDTIYVTINIA